MDGMTYEEVVPKKASKKLSYGKKLRLEEMNKYSTSSLVWVLVHRHRVGLMINFILLENIYLVLHYFAVI